MKRSTLGATVALAVFASGWSFGDYLHFRHRPAGGKLVSEVAEQSSCATARKAQRQCPDESTSQGAQ